VTVSTDHPSDFGSNGSSFHVTVIKDGKSHRVNAPYTRDYCAPCPHSDCGGHAFLFLPATKAEYDAWKARQGQKAALTVVEGGKVAAGGKA
jgi:hypothetical protein